MPEKPISYQEALKSLNGLTDNQSGGRQLLRRILQIGKADGIPVEKIANDIAEHLELTTEEVRGRLECLLSQRSIRAITPEQPAEAD